MLKRTFYVLSAAKQFHGFQYEQKIIQKFNLKKAHQYTSPYDAHLGVLNIQIKCMQYGSSVEFGDYMRNKTKNDNFILVVGFWKDFKDNIIQEHIYNVDVDILKSNLVYPYDQEMFNEMKLISNSYDDDVNWRFFCQKHRMQWMEFNNNMDLRFRRDHKRQKRIQCGISWKNYNAWFKEEMKTLTREELCYLSE